MPIGLRRSLSSLTEAAVQGGAPELEREQARLLATAVLRLFTAPALRAVGLEFEADECEAAATNPDDAALAARRCEYDIICMSEDRHRTEIEAVAELVAFNAAQAWFTAVNEVDAVVPFAGDQAALAVIAWEVPGTTRLAGDGTGWFWESVFEVVRSCNASIEADDH